MERVSDLLRGCVRVRITGAEPMSVINACAAGNIEFWGLEAQEECSLLLTVRESQAENLYEIAEKLLCETETVRKQGGKGLKKRVAARPVLWVLPLLLAAALAVSALFVWRIDITGNVTVSDREILSALRESGVYIGAFWPRFTSDLIRSRAMVKLPELKWVGVSTFGSRVSVKVREITPIPEVLDEGAPSVIVAKRGGIIEQMGTLRGFPLFENGQTAAEGDQLISPLTPGKERGGRIVRSLGYVTARTWYELHAAAPLSVAVKEYTGEKNTVYALKLGDRRINFYDSSRILHTMCDNIVEEKILGIEGFFQLPLTLVTERSEEYRLAAAPADREKVRASLEAALEAALRSALGEGGRVLSSRFTCGETDELMTVTLIAECRQNIAEERLLTEDEILALEAKLEELNGREDNGG